jgi:hypothetical protein
VKLVSKPGCNDEERLATARGDASIITSRFWTAHSLADMQKFVNPSNWVRYGRPFWTKMEKIGERDLITTADRTSYKARFDEEVKLPLFTLNALLDVFYQEREDLVRVDYRLAPDDKYGKVAVDQGFLAVTSTTLGSEGEVTLVEGAKVIRFTNPLLNRLPDLACDGGWVYLMINMALNGAGDTTGHGVAPEGPGVALEHPVEPGPDDEVDLEAVLAGIEGEVESWVDQMTASVFSHGEAAKVTARRVIAPQHDPRWMNDLVEMASRAITSVGATYAAWRRILGEVGKMGGE